MTLVWLFILARRCAGSSGSELTSRLIFHLALNAPLLGELNQNYPPCPENQALWVIMHTSKPKDATAYTAITLDIIYPIYKPVFITISVPLAAPKADAQKCTSHSSGP